MWGVGELVFCTGSIPFLSFLLNIMIRGFCVWEKNIFHLWTLAISNCSALMRTFHCAFIFLFLRFLIGLQALHISLAYLLFCTYVQCYDLWARCSKSCFHDTWRLLNSQQFIYTCIYFQFSSACLFPSVHLQMWNYFEVFLVFSHKMYHHHDFIFSLLQYT